MDLQLEIDRSHRRLQTLRERHEQEMNIAHAEIRKMSAEITKLRTQNEILRQKLGSIGAK